MANQTIIVRVEDTDIRIAGRRMTDFPQAGTLVSFEKISANATHIEGLNGTSTNVGSNGLSYRMTINLVQHSDDDVFMMAAVVALKTGPVVLPVRLKYGAVDTSSPGCVIETEPTREYAADGSPMSVYTLTGTWPAGALLLPLEAPEQLTEDQILSFINA
jgi:hypothetical protein